MIILDTHIWVWFVGESSELDPKTREFINRNQSEGIGVSSISCWEVAMLSARGRLKLRESVLDWIETALAFPNTILLPLSPRIAVESTTLPGEFHKDPADRIIVATSRIYDSPIVTYDSKMIDYPHVANHL